MGYPEPDRDESIILEAQNVKFKSISFDARLTNRRIILIDSKKNIIPPHEILLATIWKVEAGENAIRDHLLSLTVVNNAGEKDQIVLTFPRLSGAERKRECTDWANKLQSLVHPSMVEKELPGQSGSGGVPGEKHKAPVPIREDKAVRRPVKKKIETAHPLTRITEPGPGPVVPVETSSLPSGIFCLRCGSRVPPESTFCNHCGTPIRQPSEPGTVQHVDIPQVHIPVPPQAPIPVPSPAGSAVEFQDRPIEQIIHSIEPLIEDSVPRTQPTPLVKKRAPQIVSETVLTESPPGMVQPESPAGPVLPESPSEAIPAVAWPVLPPTEPSLAAVPEPVLEIPESPPPAPPAPPASKLPGNLAIAVLVIVVLAFIAGLVIAANIAPGQTVAGPNATTVKTSPVITPATPKPTTIQPTVLATTLPPTLTQVQIPSTGVWVRVTYPGTYTGVIGTPGDQADVTDSGDHFYRISTINGTVSVSVQKDDGSADRILAEVYKNGVMVKNSSTVTPHGIVEIQVDLKTV